MLDTSTLLAIVALTTIVIVAFIAIAVWTSPFHYPYFDIHIDITGRRNIDEINEQMAINPEWTEGLPLAAAGFRSDFYMKD